jgi:integrase
MRLRRALTDFAVINAKKPGEISDGGQRGLRLAVRPTGARSFIIRYRHPASGVSRKMTLPPGLSLAAARKLAADAMFLVAQGIDPIDAKKTEKQAAIAATEGTLAAVGERYLDLGSPKRSRELYRRVLARVFTHLGARPVAELKRSEVVAMLDKIARDSGPRAADLMLAVLRAMLRWYQTRSDSFVSPIIPGMARLKASEHARTRVLDDDELRRVWAACGDPRIGAYGMAIRFMLLSGGRRSEVAGLRRSEIIHVRDNGTDIMVWKLPAARSKNRKEIVRPLSRAALDIVESMPVISDSDYVFTLDGVRPMSMNYMDKKRLLDEITGVQDWVLHDTRRCFRSLLSRCRVPFEVAERLIGHARPLLDMTYNQHSFLSEMQDGVERVAGEIERIVSGERGARVIRLRS